MPEEYEVPAHHEHHIEHEAEHGVALSQQVAMFTAVLATLGAIVSYLGGHTQNEALYYKNDAVLNRALASDQWAYYQAKGIKAAVLSSKIELLEAEGRPVSAKDRQKVSDYKKDQDDITAEANEKEQSAGEHLARHVVFSRAVTLFQIAIAVGAISALTNRRPFWFVSIAFGVLGIVFLAQGFLPH